MQQTERVNTSPAKSTLQLQGQSLTQYALLFHSLFEHVEENVQITDHRARIVYMNPSMLSTLSPTQGQVLGQTNIASHDSMLKSFYDAVQNVIKTSSSTTIAVHIPKTTQTSHLYFSFNISPLLNEKQQLIGTIAVARENTTQHYLRALLDNFPFMVWLKDTESRFLANNAEFVKVTGAANYEALIGKTDFDFFHEELAQGYIKQDQDVLKTGKPTTAIDLICKAEGGEYWAETYKSPISINGQLIGTVGFTRDISERLMLLAEISKKESEYTTLVKNLPMSVILYDLNCKRTYLNQGSQTVHDLDYRQLLGKTPTEAWSPYILNMSGAEFQEKLIQVMQTGQAQKLELHCQSAELELVNLVTVFPELDENNHIIGALVIASDITEISQYRKKLEHLAYHDALTDLPNRAHLYQKMKLAIDLAEGNQHEVGLIFLDMDYFKSINDTLGHFAGDQLLIHASKRVLSCIKSQHLLARIGGDEFAVLVPDTNQEELAQLASDIGLSLARPFSIDNANFFVTGSIGVAVYPEHSQNIEGLMKYADTAMYHAKKKGRNNFQFYSHQLTSLVTERLVIETSLRYALEKNELSLHYQPKVDILTGRILGAEALLRWENPELGKVFPDAFIPIAEQSGLIVEIGAWVLMQGCLAAVKLNQHRKEPLVIAMNLSSRQFLRNDLFATLQHCLITTGCQTNWIALEITESLLLQDSEEILSTLTKIDQMGITIAIDDFGTGYSALAYLNQFPIRQVKIDRSFVNDICSNKKAALLVKAIIAMAKSLRMELVAEGIENTEQSALLARYGCFQAQGYLFSRPIPFSDFLLLVD